MRRFTLVHAVALLLAVIPAHAVGSLNRGTEGISPAELFPGARFDPSIPSPEQATGDDPGKRPLRPEEAVAYFRQLAGASPRAVFREYARSHEGRPLVNLVVGDESVLSRLDEFVEEHRARVDPRGRDANADAGVLAGAPVVAYLAYGIHGDELSSVDAAVAVAYRLVAGEDDVARDLRGGLVVVLDPCENPDGRARFLAQTVSFAHAEANPDQDDLSHSTVWPWGRGNHYLFDLNRDWFSMVQPESRRSEVLAGWKPQLVVDSHEMGSDSTYLFPPARHPFNPWLPDSARKWERPFSDDQARALDTRGYPYFNGEWNEEFFPGYGSSWASYLGAVGILYEMSGTEGTLVRKRGGAVRTYAQAVEHQVASSMANLKTLAKNRDEVLRDYVASARAAVTAGSRGPVRAWVFPWDRRYPDRMERFAGLLRRQGIEVMHLRRPAEDVAGLRDARTGASVTRHLPDRSLLVRLDQPASRLARVLLDPHVPMEAGFFRDERRHIERGRGSRLYETTAWSLALGFGLEAYWSDRIPAGEWSDSALAVDTFPVLEEPFLSVLFDGASERSAAALADLLEGGVVARVAEKPFRIADRDFARGSILIRKEGQPEGFADRVREAAQRHGVALITVTTSNSEDGPDLGGTHFKPLVPPRVAVLTGWPVSPSAYGGIWHQLDLVAGLRFSGIDVGRFSFADLERYNVVVFPPASGGASRWRAVLGESGVEKLRRWVEAGGTAIGVGNGADFLADESTALTRTRPRRQALATHAPVVWSLPALEAEGAGLFRAGGVRPPMREDDPEEGETGRRRGGPREAAPSRRTSPYDVAPVLGPGARPFTEGHDQGSALGTEPVAMTEWLKPVLPEGRKSPEEGDLESADARLRAFMPRGAFLRLELDPELWLNFGLREEATAWLGHSNLLVAGPPVEVAARFAGLDRLHLGGLLWPEAAGRIARTAYATRESVGRGQVILFVEDPIYRGWMHDTRRMFVNAVLYGPGLGTRWSRPW